MSDLKTDVVIVGAGLAGLTLAYKLSLNGVKFVLVEASQNLGGRIKTIRPKGERSHIELGATWFGPTHRHLKELLSELSLEVFEQSQNGKALFQSMSFVQPQVFDLPQGQEPTYRIVNGTDSLIKALYDKLDESKILKGFKIGRIEKDDNGLHVFDVVQNSVIHAKSVVITTPPQIAAKQIVLPNEVDSELVSLMSNTHTWMNDSIKFTLISEQAYWQEMGYSGTFFSQVGPVVEMYDHSNKANSFFALKGFLSGAVGGFSKEEREKKVRSQLDKVLPFFENSKFEYQDYNWADNTLVHVLNHIPLYPHQNNGHQKLRESIFSNSIWLGGTETARTNPGYMDGAVERANELAEILSINY